MADASTRTAIFLENLRDAGEAAKLASNPLELLRYRSNLLGEDLRITNFGGGNTSTRRPILPIDNADAICWLAGSRARRRRAT